MWGERDVFKMKEWFVANKIESLKWPAQWPDLNCIQNLWEIVDRKNQRETYISKDSPFAKEEIA